MNEAPQITPPTDYRWLSIGDDVAGLDGWALEHASGRRCWIRASDGYIARDAYFSDGAQDAIACIALAADQDQS